MRSLSDSRFSWFPRWCFNYVSSGCVRAGTHLHSCCFHIPCPLDHGRVRHGRQSAQAQVWAWQRAGPVRAQVCSLQQRDDATASALPAVQGELAAWGHGDATILRALGQSLKMTRSAGRRLILILEWLRYGVRRLRTSCHMGTGWDVLSICFRVCMDG